MSAPILETTPKTADSLKNCIAYLLEEALEAKLLMVALHLKLALDEATQASRKVKVNPGKLRQAS